MITRILFAMWGKAIHAHYQRLLDSGKLRVVKSVKRLQVRETEQGYLDRCSACMAVLSPMDAWCSGCGEKISQ